MNVKPILSIILAGCFSFPLGLCAGDQPANSIQDKTPGNYVGEAAKAVVGRVFGVEGEASDIKYHEMELTNRSPGNAAIRSAILPGWGQHFNGQRVKGTLLFAATIGALAASLRLYNKADDHYDAYKAQGKKDGVLYDDYERDHNRSLILGGAAAVLWVVGIIDAYSNAYQPLYSQNNRVDIVFHDDETRVVLKKSF